MNATHIRHMSNAELIHQARVSSNFLTFELGRRLAAQTTPLGQTVDYPLFCPEAAPFAGQGQESLTVATK